MIRALHVLLPVFLFSTSVLGQSVRKSGDNIKLFDSTVKSGKLTNGLTYFIKKNSNPANSIEMHLVVNAGIFHQDADQMELAHFLEHMAFNTLKHFPQEGSLQSFFHRNSIQRGLDWNASTTNVTNFFLKLPINKSALIDTGYLILKDFAQGIILDSQAIENERGVVLGELRQTFDYITKMKQILDSKLAENPKYDSCSVSVSAQNISRFEHNSLKRFYSDWYRPDLQAVVIVGDIDLKKTEEQIINVFSDLIMPNNPRQVVNPRKNWEIILTGENKLIVLSDPEIDMLRVRIYMKHKRLYGSTLSALPITEDDVKNGVIISLFNKLSNNRFQSLTERYNSTTLNITQAYYPCLTQPIGRLSAYGTFAYFNKAEELKKGIQFMLNEIKRSGTYGFSSPEFKKAKDELIKEVSATNRTYSNRGIADLFAAHFSEGAATNPEYIQILKNQMLNQITLDDVNKRVKQWVSDKNVDVVIESPIKYEAKLPRQSDIQQWIAEMKGINVIPYQLQPPLPQSLMTDQEINKLNGTVISQSLNSQDGVKQLMLSNGVRLVVKQIKKQDQILLTDGNVLIEGSARGGLSQYLPEDRIVAENACDIIKNAGIGPFNKFQLKKFFENKGLSYDNASGMYLSDNFSNISAECPFAEIQSLLQYLYLCFTNIRKDTEAFKDWKNNTEQGLSNSTNNFSLEFLNHAVLNSAKNSVYKQSLTRQNLYKIDEKRAYEIYQANFSDPAGFTFIITGDFNDEEIIPLLAKYLGSIPFKSQLLGSVSRISIYEKYKKIYFAGNNDKSEIKLSVDGYYEYNLKNNTLLDMIRSALDIFLFQRLREKEAGTYTPRAKVTYQKQPLGSYSFEISFDCAPDRTEYLINAAMEEFGRLKQSGIDDEMFKNMLSIAQKKLDKPRNTEWFNYINEKYIFNQEVESPDEYRKLLDTISREDIQAFIMKNLSNVTIYQNVWMPEKFRHKNENP